MCPCEPGFDLAPFGVRGYPPGLLGAKSRSLGAKKPSLGAEFEIFTAGGENFCRFGALSGVKRAPNGAPNEPVRGALGRR